MAKRVVLELGSSTNFVYSLRAPQLIEAPLFPPGYFLDPEEIFLTRKVPCDTLMLTIAYFDKGNGKATKYSSLTG